MRGNLLFHLSAIVLAVVALWSMRHELKETATGQFGWALPPMLALVIAAILLIVSPGKRFELWTVAILVGLAIGMGVGVILKVDTDFERHLVRVHKTWDGVAATSLLLLLTIARFITSELMNRPSGKFGVLGAAAAFLAAYLVGRVLTLQYYTARKSIHLDMTAGYKPKTD